MKSPPQTPSRWSRERWLLTVGICFVLQLGLLFLFAERPRSISPPAPLSTTFHLLPKPLTQEQLSASFFASDPTLFSAASQHGFSGAAWLRVPVQKYSFGDTNEATDWLALNPEQLGKNIAALTENSSELPTQVAEEPISQIGPLPFFVSAETVKTQSALRVEGELAGWKFNLREPLRVWPHTELVTNSVVQVAANLAGEVVSARLLTRCGLADADREALKIARTTRFQIGNGGKKTTTWGKMIFEWITILPATTNAVAKPE